MSDTDKLITIERLKDLLAAYGARPGLWPAEEHAAAQALIDTSDEARALYDEEQALDALLQKVAEPEVSAALQSRVRSMAIPPAPAPSASLLARMFCWLRPQSQMAWQGAVVAAGILGIVTGVGLSAVVFDAGIPVTSTLATVEIQGVEIGEAPTSVADQNNPTFSLTGEAVAETDSTPDGTDNGEGTFTVAGIPLY